MPFVPTPDKKKWDMPKPCTHPEHDPPMHIVLPAGVHTYRCPACGKIVTFRVDKPTF